MQRPSHRAFLFALRKEKKWKWGVFPSLRRRSVPGSRSAGMGGCWLLPSCWPCCPAASRWCPYTALPLCKPTWWACAWSCRATGVHRHQPPRGLQGPPKQPKWVHPSSAHQGAPGVLLPGCTSNNRVGVSLLSSWHHRQLREPTTPASATGTNALSRLRRKQVWPGGTAIRSWGCAHLQPPPRWSKHFVWF